MSEFFKTHMGQKYYTSDIPAIAKALEKIAGELSVLNESRRSAGEAQSASRTKESASEAQASGRPNTKPEAEQKGHLNPLQALAVLAYEDGIFQGIVNSQSEAEEHNAPLLSLVLSQLGGLYDGSRPEYAKRLTNIANMIHWLQRIDIVLRNSGGQLPDWEEVKNAQHLHSNAVVDDKEKAYHTLQYLLHKL
jgi:hypothetical protein